MSDARPTKDLFKAWRGGDGQAGQEMAQRFADWYYAIATSRLGESKGNGPCQRACDKFAQGIVEVTESRALVDWAYAIIDAEVRETGARTKDADEANAFTGNKKPKGLLRQARQALPEEVGLLEDVYSGRSSDEDVAKRAKPLGGMPIGVLTARYAVKRWLKSTKSVPFEVVPEKPVLDRAPLPLYESGRMKTPAEEANFEKWMLTDLDLCKDIAEFAHFAIALRGGVGGEEAGKAPAKEAAAEEKAPVAGASGAGRMALGGFALLGAGAVVLLLVVAVAIGAVVYFT
jgi:hypothetical protein